MPIRYCPNCNKNFNHKGTYDRHVNPDRKNPCIQIQLPKHKENDPKQSKLIQNDHLHDPKRSKNTRFELDENELKCLHCDKKFSNPSNLKKHVLRSCRIIKQKQEEKELVIQQLMEQMDDMKREIVSLKDRNDKMEEVVQSTTHNTNNGQVIQGNSNKINSDNKNINNNIILVAHGKEDISKIDTGSIIKAISQGYKSIPALVKEIHFNDKHPEFHNIFVSSQKDGSAMVYDGTKWMLKDRNEVLDNLYEDKIFILEDKFEEFYEELTIIARDRFNRFITDHQDPDNTDIEKKIKKNLGMMLYNYKHLPKKNKTKMLEYKN